MDETDANCILANRGGHALDRVVADITDGKDAGGSGFKRTPARVRVRRTGEDISPPVAGDARQEPLGPWCGPDEHEQSCHDLDPAIEGTATQIGQGALGHFRGRPAVARGLLQFIGPDTDTVLVPVALEQNLAVVALRRGEFTAVVRIETAAGLIRKLHPYIRFADGADPHWRARTTSSETVKRAQIRK